MPETRSLLYDADGNEVDDDGTVREIEAWQVDPKSLAGDEGEIATRPDAADL